MESNFVELVKLVLDLAEESSLLGCHQSGAIANDALMDNHIRKCRNSTAERNPAIAVLEFDAVFMLEPRSCDIATRDDQANNFGKATVNGRHKRALVGSEGLTRHKLSHGSGERKWERL